MSLEILNQYWQNTYSKCPPVGYLLREYYPKAWFRIHTLSNSKRYSDNIKEELEILNRHNLILSDLLKPYGECFVITTKYSSTKLPSKKHYYSKELQTELRYLSSSPMYNPEDETPYFWHFFATELKWQKNSIDKLLRKIANDEIRNVLFIGVRQNIVYHPYDGGADIFIKNTSKRTSTIRRYSSWLSQNSLGL